MINGTSSKMRCSNVVSTTLKDVPHNPVVYQPSLSQNLERVINLSRLLELSLLTSSSSKI